jgi:hypothetical protein
LRFSISFLLWVMNLAPVPEFADPIKTHLRRTDWGLFPDVVIHAEESAIKKHPFYPAAKSGDVSAAEGLLLETISLSAIVTLCEIIGREKVRLLPVHAVEAEGLNVIPRVMAQIIGRMIALPVEAGILQINRVKHTGASGYQRLATPALFHGNVKLGKYLLVDDFIGQGGTLANLKGYLESCGASVIGATTLTGKAYSAKLNLTAETLQNLRGKHGTELEEWWLAAFGYGFEKLTESEARYLLRADDAYTITTRIVAAERS